MTIGEMQKKVVGKDLYLGDIVWNITDMVEKDKYSVYLFVGTLNKLIFSKYDIELMLTGASVGGYEIK